MVGFSAVLWLVVIMRIDPTASIFIGQSLFFVSLFLMLTGIFALFFTWMRKMMSGGESAFVHLGMSLRQGMLLALLIIFLLIFQRLQILIWWDGLLLAAGFFIIELYFLTR
jgi:hypothetical protein